MDRRRFLCQVTSQAAAAGAVAGAAPGKGTARENRAVTYRVQGFTCITCAVGLEVMLKELGGVTRAKASYAENTVAIGFDERAIAEKTIKNFIHTCGFSVA
jgi:Cu+-exporting ATPase